MPVTSSVQSESSPHLDVDVSASAFVNVGVFRQAAVVPTYDWYSVCNSVKWQETLQKANRYAHTTGPIAIIGECGTGKDQLAEYIVSRDSEKRIVRIACGKLASELATGVDQTWSKWNSTLQQAHGQDIAAWLLEDIDQMPPAFQSQILELVAITRRTGNGTIVTTSKTSLFELVQSNQIREELYYALSVLDLSIPALRERPEDIISLCSYFSNVPMNESYLKIKLTRQALEILESYDWPGNVAELRNAIFRLRVLADRPCVDSEQLQEIWRIRPRSNADLSNLSLEDAERQLILKAIERMEGNKTAAAKQLGITPRTLHNKMKKYKSQGMMHLSPAKSKAA